MNDSRPPDDGRPTAAATRLLAEQPDARVAAIANFSALYCEMPPTVPLQGQTVIRNGRLWDVAEPTSRVAIFDAWRRLRQHGAGSAEVTLRSGRAGVVYFFDTRASFGVILCLVVEGAPEEGGLDELGPEQPARSRFGRFWRDDLGRVVKMDEAAEQLLGFSEEELRQQEAVDRIDPAHHDLAFENWIETLSSPGVPRRWRCRHLRKDGTWLWVEITNTNHLADADGLVLSEMMDIADEMAANERLREREELLDRLAESLPSGIAQVDRDGAVVYTNKRLHEILGMRPKATLQAQFATAVMADRPRVASAVDRVVSTGADVDLQINLARHGERQPRICQLTLRALRDGEGAVSGAVVTVEDITEGTVLRQELERRANLDPLTACCNRATTMAELEHILDQRVQPDLGTGVVFIDLDEFKPINDRLGHAAGDEVLVEAAARLRRAVRAPDLVGRIGGDEFLVVCPGLNRPEVAVTVAERIASELTRPLTLATGESVALRASIGVAWSVNEETTADRLVARADEAMYGAKRRADGVPALAPDDASEAPAGR